VGQAVDGETSGVALFFEYKQQGLAPSIGPLHQQGNIELAKAFAETRLQLLLAHGCNPGCADRIGLVRGEEGQCLVRIVEDEVFEVLVMTQELILTDSPASICIIPTLYVGVTIPDILVGLVVTRFVPSKT